MTLLPLRRMACCGHALCTSSLAAAAQASHYLQSTRMLVLRLQSGELLLVHCRASIDRELPFELRVLEGALSGVMQELGAEITELIDMAVPALDALISHVSLLPGCILASNVSLTGKQCKSTTDRFCQHACHRHTEYAFFQLPAIIASL